MFNINDVMDRFYIESMENDIYIEKLSMLYEMVDRECALNVNQAELKVYKENGTYDDLEYLVEAAEAEAEVKKQSIFAKMLDAIANAFRTISNAIKNFINKDKANNDQEEIVEISADVEKKYNEFLHCWKSIQSGFNKIKSGDWSGVVTVLKGLTIPSIVVAAGTTATVQMVKKKRGEVTKMSQMLSYISDKISSGIESIKNFFKKDEKKKTKDNKQPEAQKIFIRKLNDAKEFVQKLLRKIHSSREYKKGTSEAMRINRKDALETAKDKRIDRNLDYAIKTFGGTIELPSDKDLYFDKLDKSLKNKNTIKVSESVNIDDSLFDELINEATITESFTDDIQDLMDFFDID